MAQFFESIDNGISHQFVKFDVAHVTYIMDFSSDEDVLAGVIALDNEIAAILNQRKVCTVKFAVEEYYESEDLEIDLYAPPKDHHFGKAEIQSLKRQLENLLLEHHKHFQPECYFFVAERPSLARMYQKMCDNKALAMVEFEPLSQLGENKDCFIIKTPTWRKNVRQKINGCGA